MLNSYQWLLGQCKKQTRGYAILNRMQTTLEIMKQKKNELVKPTKVKQTQIESNIAYFLNIITEK